MDPKDMLFAYDLEGRDVTVTITHVVGGELTGEQGRKTKKPIAHIKGSPKRLALNNTNCQTIEQLTGTSNTDEWRDIRVTLFPTTTSFGGKTVECIRVRPYPPREKESGGSGNGGRKSRGATEPVSDVPTGHEQPAAASDATPSAEAGNV